MVEKQSSFLSLSENCEWDSSKDCPREQTGSLLYSQEDNS